MSRKCDFLFPHASIMDNKHANVYITSDPNILSPKAHTILINHNKMKTPVTKPWALIELTSQTLLSLQLTTRRLRRISGQKKHLVSACLFLCSLCIYSLLSLIFFFSPLSTSFSPAAFSHTQAVWWRCSRERRIWVTIWNQLWRRCSHPETQWRMGILYL